MRTALVLGAGGTVGLAYHVGALRALEREGGLRPNDADLIIGTSAGSVVGAYLRAGWSTEDLWALVLAADEGAERSLSDSSPASGRLGRWDRRTEVFRPTFRTPVELVRRGLGSAYVLGRSVVRVPVPAVPRFLQHAFPGGLFGMDAGEHRFAAELPASWPERTLWLCAVDIVSGQRVVLGGRGAPRLSLPEAVTASCAIPGVYPPVRLGRRVLVDGGAHSPTNLDLAVRAGCRVVIGVAPMAFDPGRPPDLVAQLVRRLPARLLSAEFAHARSRGVEVLLLRPSADEVRVQGLRMMRAEGIDRVARAAYDGTAELVGTDRFQRALADMAA